MKIKVIGAGHKRSNQLKKATEFYANYLMHKNKVRHLDIEIEVSKLYDAQGTCVNEDEEKPPKFFTIQLRDHKDDNMFHTLAHEMVHLKQYAQRELTKDLVTTDKDGSLKLVTLWNGKPYKFKSSEDEYYDSPWEIEAYGREDHLYWKWTQFNEN